MSNLTFNIYGCGGTGVNIIRQRDIVVDEGLVGFPKVNLIAVDTSTANIGGKTPDDITLELIPGVDGMGKSRKLALEECRPHVNKILSRNKPADFNLFIFSLSGGTGSVIGPLLMAECIKRKENVVAITVGNFTNIKETVNSRDTMATLQGISRKLESTVAISSYWLDEENTQDVVDGLIEEDIRALMILASGDNAGLDTRDISNWINYNNVIEAAPQLVELSVYSGKSTKDLTEGPGIISVASLYVDKDQPMVSIGQAYDTYGILPEAMVNITKQEPSNYHYVLSIGNLIENINVLAKRAESAQNSLKELSSTVVPVLDGDDDDDGFVV